MTGHIIIYVLISIQAIMTNTHKTTPNVPSMPAIYPHEILPPSPDLALLYDTQMHEIDSSINYVTLEHFRILSNLSVAP